MFGSAKQLYSGEIYLQSATFEGEYYGTVGQDQYGDLYQYGRVGVANITAGKLQLAPAPIANHANRPAAAAVTADGRNNQVSIDLAATAAAADEYTGGLLVANDVAPEGIQYRITGHPAAVSDANVLITVDRPFIESITTSSEFSLVHNAHNGVVEAAVATRRPAGVPLVDMTAGYYGWFKVRGVASVLAGTAVTLGAQLMSSTATAGAVVDATDVTAPQAEVIVGRASIMAGVDTEFRPIELTIR